LGAAQGYFIAHTWQHLRVGWLNVPSLASKYAAVHETTVANRASQGIPASDELLVYISSKVAQLQRR